MYQGAEILSVGTELLLGDIVNTDAAYLARELAALGIPCFYQSVVGDNPDRLRAMLQNACMRSDLIILTGGLGPTCDDLTKECAAGLLSKTLVLHEPSYARIQAILARRGLPETDNQKKQAMLPADAFVFRNDYGTAPGFAMEGDFCGRHVTMILLPGPPRELEPLFAEQVRPYLAEKTGGTIYSLNIGLYGIGEAAVEAVLRDRMEHGQNPTVAPYCGEGEVRLRLTARGESEESCRAMCLSAAEEIRMVSLAPYRDSILDDHIYGIGCESLGEALVGLLREKKLHISFAESCTGGYAAKRVTDIPGASEVFDGAFVTYSEAVKTAYAGVKPETLSACSVYSQEVAREMADGCRAAFGADIGIGITGLAGTDGAERTYHGRTEWLDAGTVFVSCSYIRNQTVCYEDIRLSLSPGRRAPLEAREYIRRRASSEALWMAIKTARIL